MYGTSSLWRGWIGRRRGAGCEEKGITLAQARRARGLDAG
jgi:hypothetical protein